MRFSCQYFFAVTTVFAALLVSGGGNSEESAYSRIERPVPQHQYSLLRGFVSGATLRLNEERQHFHRSAEPAEMPRTSLSFFGERHQTEFLLSPLARLERNASCTSGKPVCDFGPAPASTLPAHSGWFTTANRLTRPGNFATLGGRANPSRAGPF